MRGRNLLYSGLYALVAITLALPYIYFMVANSVTSTAMVHRGAVPMMAFFRESGRLALIIFLSCLIGFSWSKKLGLSGMGTLDDLKANWARILIYGSFIGLMVYLFGDRYFIKLAPGFYPAQLRYAFFVPFYAALIEEVFARFGVMTLLVKIFGNIHIANILAALIFAIGHVNMFQVAGIIYRLNYLTVCSFILNLGISLFFGYIYWKKGLLTAMSIHFVANLRYLIIALFL